MRSDHVLVIDDEPAVRLVVRTFLEAHGYLVKEAATAAEAVAVYRDAPPDLAICDYELPDGNGIDLLAELRTLEPGTPAVMLTGHGSIELAVRAIKEGAEQFLTKPVDLSALKVIVERVLEKRRLERRHRAGEIRSAGTPDPFVGTSQAIRRLEKEARRVAASDATVLLLGETGTGKGVLARWLHTQGARSREAFLDLNCAGLPHELLESELFGYAKGAFTGAVQAKMGLFEVADHGTVFLDEVADMDLRVQPKLLQVLEEERFRRLGDVRDRTVDVRLIAATHQDLADMVQRKVFRSDLYFRINTFPLNIPPLRTRGEDIPLLARVLVDQLSNDLARPALRLSDEAAAALREYAWPGNVRELRNVLERAAILCTGDVLGRQDLRFDVDAAGSARDTTAVTGLTLEQVERGHIEAVLRDTGGNVPEAAQKLGVPRSSLYQKIIRYGIDVGAL